MTMLIQTRCRKISQHEGGRHVHLVPVQPQKPLLGGEVILALTDDAEGQETWTVGTGYLVTIYPSEPVAEAPPVADPGVPGFCEP